ncbi:hypothetical protein RLJV_19550 [Pseudomonas aeruginosa]|nr:hypothetical protein RLJV_19550 [Pseudomonas aeruginosa]
MQAIFACFPGQVERIDGNTVPSQARPWIIRGKSKRFGRCSIYHFKNIDTHSVRDYFHLIDQADIHRAMNIFQQFGHFRSFGRAHWNYFIYSLFVKSDSNFQAFRGMPPNYLWNSAGFKIRITWIFTLWRID